MTGAHVLGAFDATALAEAGPTILASLNEWSNATPDSPAVSIYASDGRPQSQLTYRELARVVGAASRTLQDTLAPDQTAILNHPNGAEFVVWFLAGLHAGVRIAPVHSASTRHELGHALRRRGACAIIGPDPHPPLRHLTLGSLGSADPAPLLPCKGRSPGAVVLESSGTSGLSRLVLRSERSLDADARGVVRGANLTRHDRILFVVPMSHSYGVDLLVASVVSGASVHVLAGFEIAHVQGLIRRGAVTVFPGVPFMFEALARTPELRPGVGFRLALSAGSSLPEHINARLRSECGLVVGQLYGATELGTVAIDHPDRAEFDPRSVGTPLPGVSVRILSSDNAELPVGSEGEIAVRSPTMLTEYLEAPLELWDGHYRTGDLGRLDASGRLHVTGRLTHLIDVGGLKVNPVEVERLMCEHPAIAECALVPLPLSDTIVRLRLLVVPHAGMSLSTDEVRVFARERLSPHKLPRVFETVQSLPRTPTGKLLRHLLGSQ